MILLNTAVLFYFFCAVCAQEMFPALCVRATLTLKATLGRIDGLSGFSCSENERLSKVNRKDANTLASC